MSNPLKKIVDGVKKVFKKVVKTVKKVVKSDYFKIAVAAAAIYFTAGAAAGTLGGASAGAGAAAGSAAAGTSMAATAAAMPGMTAASAAASSAAAASSGIMGSLAAAGSKVMAAGKAAGGWASKNQLLASAALSTGGNMLSAYAADEDRKNRENTIRQNREYDLNVYDSFKADRPAYANEGAGQRPAYAQEGGPSPVQRTQNVENPKSRYYDASKDSWSPIARTSQGGKTA